MTLFLAVLIFLFSLWILRFVFGFSYRKVSDANTSVMVSENGPMTVHQKKIYFEKLYGSESTTHRSPLKTPNTDENPEKETQRFLVPPQKPKRTFQHDIYLESKMCVSAPCSSRASSCMSMGSPTQKISTDSAHTTAVAQKVSPIHLKGHPKFFQLSHDFEGSFRAAVAYDQPRPLEVSFRRHRSNENVYATPIVMHDHSMESSSSSLTSQSLYYASADVARASSQLSQKDLDAPLLSSESSPSRYQKSTPKNNLSRKFAFKKSVRDSDVRIESGDSLSPPEAEQTSSLERRVSRARLVRRRTLALYDNQVQAFVSRKAPQLFESAFLVELQATEDVSISPQSGRIIHKPVITYRFSCEPGNNREPPELFFPDYSRNCTYKKGDHWGGDEEFVIALTNHIAERKNAYCVKFLPNREQTDEPVSPKVLVVISPIKNANFYLDLVRNAVIYAKVSEKSLDGFLNSVFHQEYPQKRGSCLVILEKDATGGTKRVEIRNLGTAIGKQGISQVMERMSPEVVVCVVAALLGDQRVLIAGNTVSVVAQTIQCLEALILPFVWPHTYVPVVPDNLADLAHNPTPYLMGILRSNLSPLRDLIVDDSNNNDKTQMDFVFVDIDNGLINPRPKHFDCNKDKDAWKSASAQSYCQRLGMPKKASTHLIKGFRGAMQSGAGPAADVKIENAMLHWYAMMFGHYKSVGAHTEWGDKMKAKLISSHSNPQMRPYLAYLCETAMFTEWIEKKQQKATSSSAEEVPGSEEALNKKLDEIAATHLSSMKPLASLVSKVSTAFHLSGGKKK